MKIVSWNVNRARATGKKAAVWEYFNALNPDLALLQEVGNLPEGVSKDYNVLLKTPVTRRGEPQKFQTALLSRYPIASPVDLTSDHDWVRGQASFFAGNMFCAAVVHPALGPINVVCVYAPAWPIARSEWSGIDVANLKLAANPDIWPTEILWDLLRTSMPGHSPHWIVGGDFNSSPTLDDGPRGDRGNREMIARLNCLGLTEALCTFHGRLVPTFRNIGAAVLVHQLDHLFLSPDLAGRVTACRTCDADSIVGKGLSDHLPIIADLAVDAV